MKLLNHLPHKAPPNPHPKAPHTNHPTDSSYTQKALFTHHPNSQPKNPYQY